MLPKKNRLKKTLEINQVFAKGKFLSCSFLSFKYLLLPNKEIKIAFSIGISYSPKATERNRAKRILRAVTQKKIAKIPKGLNGVFFINKKKFPSTIQEAEKFLPKLSNIILKDLIKNNGIHN